MLIALVVLVGTAILSYLLIKTQRKHQLEVEQEVRE